MNSGIKCLLIAVCILGATSPNTLAQSFGPAPINNCDEYAARARAQVEMACPHPNDPRWVRDDVAHRTWCLTASPERRAIEDEARRNGLVQGCRQAVSAQDVGNCNEYAWRAEAEIEIASILGQFAPRCKNVWTTMGPRPGSASGLVQQSAAAPASEEDHARRIAVATCAVSAHPPSPGSPIK
jgi:hypothetical protein